VPSNVTYSYRARRADGRPASGTVRAQSVGDADRILRDQGRYAFTIAQRTAQMWGTRRRSSVMQRIGFYRSFAQLDAVGVSIDAGFNLIIEQSAGRGGKLRWRWPWETHAAARFVETLRAVHHDMTVNGLRLHEAMARRPDDFSDLEVAMMAAGEEAGKRPGIALMLARFLESDRKQARRLAAALANPLFLLLTGTSIFTYLAVVIIPQFAYFYRQFGVAIPGVMRAMLAVGTALHNPIGLAIVLGWLAVCGYFGFAALRTERGLLLFDEARLRLPVFGPLVAKATTARFARVVAMLLAAGIDRIRTFEVAIPVVASPAFGRALLEAKDRLAQGDVATVAEALRESHIFESMLLGFVDVGERTGKIPEMLERVAEYYEDDCDAIIEALPGVLQAILTIVMGVFIGFIAYAVYVPLTTLASRLH
jgi:type II secretory pathway component PulF